MKILRYTPDKAAEWDKLVRDSKNGTFLLERSYMDYHQDKFCDHSLMLYKKGRLLAVLPANVSGDTVYSHQGLTYGGLILSAKAAMVDVLEAFECMNAYYKAQGYKKMVYKPIPYIYHTMPSQEDLYALFRMKGMKLVSRGISSTLYQDNKIAFTESRKSGIRKAMREGVVVKESVDVEAFWNVLNSNLMEKYGLSPVHTAAELAMLMERFPDNIKLYVAEKDGEVLGGTLLFVTKQVVHTQYIAPSPEGKKMGALDALFDYVINNKYVDCPVFDFGISTEQQGRVLNESLIFQKEGFGGRGTVYDVYEYEL